MREPEFDPKTGTISQRINGGLLTTYLNKRKVAHIRKDADTLLLNQIVFRADFYQDSRVYHGWVLAPYVNPELAENVEEELIPYDIFDSITGERL